MEESDIVFGSYIPTFNLGINKNSVEDILKMGNSLMSGEKDVSRKNKYSIQPIYTTGDKQ